MYKMIAIDVDDTLVDDERTISPGTKEALAEAVRRGITVTLATGRMFPSAKQMAGQLGLNVPIITYQGSVVKNLLDEKIIYERFLTGEPARLIFDYARKNGLHLQTYLDDKLIAAEDNDKVRLYSRMSNVPYTVVPDFAELVNRRHTKLLIIDEPEKLDAIIPELRELLGDQVHLTKSKPHYLEFIHPEGTKGSALKFLASHYGYDLSEVIAVGDSWNDHDMLETAGLGVAMANAIEPLKQIADYVSPFSNNEEGVKHVVKKFLLQQE